MSFKELFSCLDDPGFLLMTRGLIPPRPVREKAIVGKLGVLTRVHQRVLTESSLLALAAGILGVAMAYWTMDLIMAFAPPVDIPLDLGLRMDVMTLAFAVAVSAITGRTLS